MRTILVIASAVLCLFHAIPAFAQAILLQQGARQEDGAKLKNPVDLVPAQQPLVLAAPEDRLVKSFVSMKPYRFGDEKDVLELGSVLPPGTLDGFAPRDDCSRALSVAAADAQVNFSPSKAASFKRFDEKCMNRLSVDDLQASSPYFGVIYNHAVSAFVCSGVLIDGNHVATARHCIFPITEYGERVDAKPLPATNPPLLFFPLSQPKTAYVVEALTDPLGGAPYSGTDRKRDFAGLRLKGLVPGVAGLTSMRGEQAGGFVGVVGLSGSAIRYATEQPARPVADSKGGWTIPAGSAPLWTEFVRTLKGASCKVVANPDRAHRCMVHSCQTDLGMSGAPIFTAAGIPVGMQVGSLASSERTYEACGWDYPALAYNVAIAVPDLASLLKP